MGGELERIQAVLYAEGEERPVELLVRRYSRRERLRSAGRLLATLWALAVGAVFIPLLHLVLVPGLLLGGLAGAAFRYRRKTRFETFEADCPVCAERHVFSLDGEAEIPKLPTCPTLDVPMVLKRAVPSAT